MSGAVEKNFVIFMSPGTFVAEEEMRSIASWNVEEAVAMAGTIVARYGARPFAFLFIRRRREPGDLDSHVADRSCIYYLGGRVETRGVVEARNDPGEEILRANMRSNGISKIIINDNSYRTAREFSDGDVLLDVTLPPLPAEDGA